MGLNSNQGKIPEFTMVNILNSSKRSYKAPGKQLKEKKGGGDRNTKQTNKKENKQNKKPKNKNKQTNKQTRKKNQKQTKPKTTV